MSVWISKNANQNDLFGFAVEFLDAGDASIAPGLIDLWGSDDADDQTWRQRAATVSIPPGARKARIFLEGGCQSGSGCTAHFDNISATMVANGGPFSSSAL